MDNYYYMTAVDRDNLFNAATFGKDILILELATNSDGFGKYYITEGNWDNWKSITANTLLIESVFSVTLSDFEVNNLVKLTELDYITHRDDTENDPISFANLETELCREARDEFLIEVDALVNGGTITQLDTATLANMFNDKSPILIPGTSVYIESSITELLINTPSLHLCKTRLELTPINAAIGFTQELKDRYVARLAAQISILHI
jgi:hypothetical protein